ncbi:ScpA family protein [Alphaproteobacteria bacterium LSUCC0744]
MTDFEDSFSDDKAPQDPAQQLALFVNLDGFEGPIDLLLTLARDQKVDLTKIAILPLAEQYLAFVNDARELDLEIAADYLVMAAWLAYLKSRLLLPDPEPEQAEEMVDMADALRYQLLRLEAMQQAAKRISSLPRLGQQRFARGAPEQFANTSEAIWTATLYDLLSCYGDIQSAEDTETLTIAATRLFSVEEAAKRLRNMIGSSPDWTVLQHFLPAGLQSPMDLRSATASHFVASLELAREGVLRLRQDNHFAPLYMKVRD